MKKFISLLSGGLDSPIAAYLMMNQQLTPIFVSFLTSDDNEESMKRKVIKIVTELKKCSKVQLKLYLIYHDPNLNLLKTKCERKLTCVLCKRFMIRIAQKIGNLENTNIIVTGDILGEQASQTLDNLYVYNDLLKNHILLRPLIGMDKLEVIKLNQKSGLYDITSKTTAGCQFNPQFPETHAKPDEIIREESVIQIENLINDSISKSEVLFF